MDWAKISVHLDADPRIHAAGLEAAWYHLSAILYCKRTESDGVVPASAARVLGGGLLDDPAGARQACVEHGLLRQRDNGDVVVCGWLDWNRSASEIEALRQERQEAGRKGAESRWHGKGDGKSHSKLDGKSDGKTMAEVEVEVERDVEGEVDEKHMSNGKRSTAVVSADVDRVWEAYHAHHQAASLTDKRRKLIRARLKEGRTADDLVAAIEGCHASPFHMGENDRNTRFDTIELILRDAGKVESFMAMWRDPPAGKRSRAAQIYAMAEGLPDVVESTAEEVSE